MTHGTTTVVTDEQRSTYDRDGVVHVPGAVDASWFAAIGAVADRELSTPGRWVTDTNPGGVTDRLFTTRYLWPTDPTVAAFAAASGVARLAAELMGSASARLYFDHLLVKEPWTTAPTPWHQDLPYWPFLGDRICSVWVAMADVTVEESSLQFVRGSHRWGRTFAPESFDDEPGWTQEFVGERLPDIDADRDAYDIVGFDVAAGDALVFSAHLVHGSPPNTGPGRRIALSTRWLGDDAVWHPHPGADPTVTAADTSCRPGELIDDDERFPRHWPR